MKILDKAYNFMLEKAQGDQALFWVGFIAFLEGFISPIPPDPMLAIMAAVKKANASTLAAICTISSVVGGVIGYFLGYLLYDSVGKWILDLYGYSNTTIPNLNTIAFAAIALKALTPIPYKVVAIIAGFMRVDFVVFATASLLSRYIRFFIVSVICKKYGDFFLKILEKYKLLICILIIVALIVGCLLIKYI